MNGLQLNKVFILYVLGTHPNIIGLIGLREEKDTLMLVMDQAQPCLKQYLLDSRALEHSPEYAGTYNR